jgi:hypothetical protein
MSAAVGIPAVQLRGLFQLPRPAPVQVESAANAGPAADAMAIARLETPRRRATRLERHDRLFLGMVSPPGFRIDSRLLLSIFIYSQKIPWVIVSDKLKARTHVL